MNMKTFIALGFLVLSSVGCSTTALQSKITYRDCVSKGGIWYFNSNDTDRYPHPICYLPDRLAH
jgi:hypothetical protein